MSLKEFGLWRFYCEVGSTWILVHQLRRVRACSCESRAIHFGVNLLRTPLRDHFVHYMVTCLRRPTIFCSCGYSCFFFLAYHCFSLNIIYFLVNYQSRFKFKFWITLSKKKYYQLCQLLLTICHFLVNGFLVFLLHFIF